MPELTSGSIDDLLSQAEERLLSRYSGSNLTTFSTVGLIHDAPKAKIREEHLSVRQSQISMALAAKKNVGRFLNSLSCHYQLSLLVFLLVKTVVWRSPHSW